MSNPAAVNAIAELAGLLSYLTPDEQAEVDKILRAETGIWVPLPGPQTMAYESQADILYYGGSVGGAKALDVTTPLPTPGGFRTMEEIGIGDSLFDEAGKPCNVVAVSEVFANHRCYRLTFSDGSEIVADAGHKWQTLTIADRAVEAAGRVQTTEEIEMTLTLPEARNTLMIDNQRYIVSCVRVPSVEVKCVAVDSPSHLYLAGQSMIPTHNTDLLLGLSLTQHRRTAFFRRELTQLEAVLDRLCDIVGTRDLLNESKHIYRGRDGRVIEFGGVKDLGNEHRWQGRPHDLIVFDEITEFLETMFKFLSGWNRTTHQGQRCRIVCAGNPPLDSDGQWVTSYWGAWLDPQHPNPAQPGELRWYTTIDGVDTPVDGPEPFMHKGQLLKPRSRTFIPSRLEDNPFLMATDYMSTVQALPEPLRSQMLGSFTAGHEDDAFQVIPTSWIDSAMERWTEDGRRGMMDSVGVDVARGGKDKTTISTRYGVWYAPMRRWPGKETPDGGITAGLIVSEVMDRAPIHVDVIGPGGSVVDHLANNNVHVVAINGAQKPPMDAKDKASGVLRFRNMRAYMYWRFRESLDPKTGDNIALPPDPQLKADLCAAHWKLTPGGILIEDKDAIKKRIGRSPDDGDAVIY